MTTFRILTLNNISHQALLRFTPDRYAVGNRIATTNGHQRAHEGA